MTPSEKRYRAIWRQVAAIPPGCVATYGQIAEQAGLPRGARLVGRALGQAPTSLELPWFRVLNSQGRISLKKGGRGWKEQCRLLTADGVVVEDGRVDLKKHRWTPTLDELMWGPAAGALDGEEGF
jgi:methylated-DNA-protein-cysteine methyltransferase-like protein